ncbi:MAG TPA: BadF/BadG/BcrA/BcrD ATPase family protein [Jatrophihabitantaceae bacterium]
MTRLALGIDAGGTRTRCLVVDETGAQVGTGSAAGANPNSSADTVAAFTTALRAATAGVPREVALPIASAVVAVAGAGAAGRPAAERAVRAAADATGILFDALHVCSDCEAAFAGGSTDPDGTVLVAGTGSVAAAITGYTVVRRRDGHGYLLGDQGSALAIAIAAVRAVLADLEGAGPATALRDPVLAAVRDDAAVRGRTDAAELDDVQAVLAAVYGNPPAHVATLAPLVDVAAAAGDRVALRIVDDAVSALVETVRVVRSDADALVITGGVASGDGLLGIRLRAALEATFGVLPRVVHDGVRGAAALALRRLPGIADGVADQLVC